MGVSQNNRAFHSAAFPTVLLLLALPPFAPAQAIGATVRFEGILALDFVDPRLPHSRYDYTNSVWLDTESRRWLMTLESPDHKILFDGSEVIETRVQERRNQNGKPQLETNAVVHFQYHEVPVT